MTMIKKLKATIPFIMLFVLLSMLWHELYSTGSSKYNSSMTGETVPVFALETVANPNKTFSSSALKGRVTLLNIFATWCSACNAEHNMLMRINKEYHIPIYGILYRDNGAQAKLWLARYGNPYVTIGNDPRGSTGVDLGIYGTPETLVISPQGRIVYRHPGSISQRDWDNTIYPIIQKYENIPNY